MGSPTLTPGPTTVLQAGIFAVPTMGNPTVTTGSVTVSLSGIGTAESLGDIGVFSGFITMSPTGIGSTGAVGDIRITVPPVNVFLGDIQFDSQLGSPTVGVLTTIATAPTRNPYPVAENSPLFLREFLTQGVTFYRVGTEWFTGNDLPEDLEADELYRGGYEYLVSAAKGAELQALGFTIRTEIR
jgi:hypothetical protein